MDEIDKKDDKSEKDILEILKINIFSKDEEINQRFLKEIKAVDLFEGPIQLEIGVKFANLRYQTSKRYFLQFWVISNKSRFGQMIPNFLLGSRGIIYFYQINEKIEENRLKLVKSEITLKVPILFVGYDSFLPKNPEKVDPNIQIIMNYFNEFNSLYISVDNRDCMFQILDRMISLSTSE